MQRVGLLCGCRGEYALPLHGWVCLPGIASHAAPSVKGVRGFRIRRNRLFLRITRPEGISPQARDQNKTPTDLAPKPRARLICLDSITGKGPSHPSPSPPLPQACGSRVGQCWLKHTSDPSLPGHPSPAWVSGGRLPRGKTADDYRIAGEAPSRHASPAVFSM